METGHARLVGVSAERLLCLEALDMVGYICWLPCDMSLPSLLFQCKSAVLEERSGETKEVGNGVF